MKACLSAFSVFALVTCLVSLMVTDMHYIDCDELPPVYNTIIYVVLRTLVIFKFLCF